VKVAVYGCAETFKFASVELKGDRELVILGLKGGWIGSTESWPDELFEDEEVNELLNNLSNKQVDYDPSLVEMTSQSSETEKTLNIKPPPFTETVLMLKAAATQLISIMVLSLVLLPLFDEGFSFWDQGAEKFVFTNFNFPKLSVQFSVSFSWPKFEQPHLQIQLAFGFLLTGLLYFIKYGKWFMLRYATSISMDKKVPEEWETLMLNIFSSITWKVFRMPMTQIQLSIERLMLEMSLKWESKDYQGFGIMLFSAFPLIMYYSYQFPFTKTMPSNSGNNEVITFCKSEDSMSVQVIELLGKGTTLASINAVIGSCSWIQITRLKLSPSVEISLVDLAEVLRPFQSSLKELDFTNCTLIHGNVSDLKEFKALQKLAIYHCSVSLDDISTALIGENHFLIEAISNAPVTDIQDVTAALFFAVGFNHIPVVKSLIEAGGDMNDPGVRRQSPMDLAIGNDNEDLLKVIETTMNKLKGEEKN
jgi:hypothetical protein